MLAGRCSSQLSGHQNLKKNQKSHNLRPERTRISYIAALTVTTCAAFSKESRMKSANATDLDRKSGAAQGTCCFTFGYSECAVGRSRS